ncbi:hypothetical protein SPONN_1170 [uncultured Candidatus Thioglobus sp.]|nr:hypothetical protein SPONL_2228 [uncultured Candidatus Thioglobus sp.]SMN02494.1 hypothetical protein SPONN_1170 [uncultured Candidatus Thioglobus sp.]
MPRLSTFLIPHYQARFVGMYSRFVVGNAISIASEAIKIAFPLCKYHCCWK